MEEKKLYPMKLIPKEISLPWGTYTHLVADLGYEESKIGNGFLAGDTLDDIMETYIERVIGDEIYSFYGRQFPLSISTIDVSSGISPVTVCPGDELAAARYDALGKKKLWYVADAGSGASVLLGPRSATDAALLYDSCAGGTVTDILREIPVRKGDFFVIPPGTMHAARNARIIEVSEASGLDFTIYAEDTESKDNLDALVEALDFIDLNPYEANGIHAHSDGDHVSRQLHRCDEFAVTEIRLTDALHIYTERFSSFITYTCLSGEASFQLPKDGPVGMETFLLAGGQTLLIPAELGDFYIVPIDRNTVLIEATVPPREIQDAYVQGEEHHHHDGCDCDHHDHHDHQHYHN